MTAARHLAEPSPVATFVTPDATAAEAIAELTDDFALLEDWTARYQYLIDLGKNLPPLPPEWQTDETLLRGCQSRVWFTVAPQAGRLFLFAASDSTIVSGLIALLARVYSGRMPTDILAIDTGFLRDLGLEAHLSPTRKNGLAAMVTALRDVAEASR